MRLTNRHVTLRSVGWRRVGILEPVYAKMAGEEAPVKKLAELTGIPAGNLSTINSGKRDMTSAYAERIAKAVPGISPVAHLGAPEAKEGDRLGRDVLARLAELEEGLTRLTRDVRRLADQVTVPARPGQTKTRRGAGPKKR